MGAKEQDFSRNGVQEAEAKYSRTSFGTFTVQAFASLTSYDKALLSERALMRKYMMRRHLYFHREL
jgi:hypothetical protein